MHNVSIEHVMSSLVIIYCICEVLHCFTIFFWHEKGICGLNMLPFCTCSIESNKSFLNVYIQKWFITFNTTCAKWQHIQTTDPLFMSKENCETMQHFTYTVYNYKTGHDMFNRNIMHSLVSHKSGYIILLVYFLS